MRTAFTFAFALLAALALPACRKSPPPPAPAPEPSQAHDEPEWQLLASELPSALLSVSGRSPSDVYAVGSDKGQGPLVLHFDGKKWAELHTGTRGDLWWVQALPNGPVLLGGAHGTLLRFDGKRFESVKPPSSAALATQTIYGVWGASADDFYAVGNVEGKNGFVWHFHAGAFENEVLPPSLHLPRMAGGEAPGFFKVFGVGDDVWVVGAAGVILRRAGAAPFALVPTTTKDTLFTVHGTRDHLLAVGGSGNGVLLEANNAKNGAFHDASPAAAGLLQGVFATDHGDWATGERGFIYTRPSGSAAFTLVDHGLALPATVALHSVFVDSAGGVWSVGGNVLSTALDNGVLLHEGATVPTVVIEDEDGGGTSR